MTSAYPVPHQRPVFQPTVLQRMMGAASGSSDGSGDDDDEEERPWERIQREKEEKARALKAEKTKASKSAQSTGKASSKGKASKSALTSTVTPQNTVSPTKRNFGINITTHVRGDIIHYAALAASVPNAAFSFDEYNSTDWFERRAEIEAWLHFLELNGAEFEPPEVLGDEDDFKFKRSESPGEATLTLVEKLKRQERVDFRPAVLNRPHHTNKYIKELLEERCPGIATPGPKCLIWVRSKDQYHVHRNSPLELLSMLVGCAKGAGMAPILIGDKPATKVNGVSLDLTEFWKWEEVVPGPMKIRRRPFSGVDSIQRQILFLELLKTDYGVCAQLGVKSGALDSMGIHGLKTIVVDLEPQERLRLRMARFATFASNYFIVYPQVLREHQSSSISFPEKSSGQLVLHRGAENPKHGDTKEVVNEDSPKKKKDVEYSLGEVDWEETIVSLLRK